jgi:hypothetical protein
LVPGQLALLDVLVDVVEIVAQQLVYYEERLAKVEDIEQEGQSAARGGDMVGQGLRGPRVAKEGGGVV